jgi:hypothetical protein
MRSDRPKFRRWILRITRLQNRPAVHNVHPHMRLGLSNDDLRIVRRTLNEHVHVLAADGDCGQRDSLDTKTFHGKGGDTLAFFRSEDHRWKLLQIFGVFEDALVEFRRGRWNFIVAFHVPPMVAFAPTARVAAKPTSVGGGGAVIPMLPAGSFVAHDVFSKCAHIGPMPCKAWAWGRPFSRYPISTSKSPANIALPGWTWTFLTLPSRGE